MAFFAWTLWEAREWWFRARLFPWAIGFAGLALALLQAMSDTMAVLNPDPQAGKQSATKTPLWRDNEPSAWWLGFLVFSPPYGSSVSRRRSAYYTPLPQGRL